MSTHEEVAQWMFSQLEEKQYLYQEMVVYDMMSKFGEGFTYINENGNPAIDRRVLRDFRKLTKDNVVWERGERMWRFRQSYDTADKRQAE